MSTGSSTPRFAAPIAAPAESLPQTLPALLDDVWRRIGAGLNGRWPPWALPMLATLSPHGHGPTWPKKPRDRAGIGRHRPPNFGGRQRAPLTCPVSAIQRESPAGRAKLSSGMALCSGRCLQGSRVGLPMFQFGPSSPRTHPRAGAAANTRVRSSRETGLTR